TYQWQRCDAGSCTNIAGATEPTHALQAADVGATLQVVVTATNAAGNASATSEATATIAAAAPLVSAKAIISAAPLAAHTLTETNTPSRHAALPIYTYQWQRCDAGSCTNIAGATEPTHALQAADVGATLQAVVTATNAAGNASATSEATATIAAA